MPPTSHFRPFLIVFTCLCLLAFVLVLLDEIGGIKWAAIAVDVGQNSSRMFFGAIALTFIVVEGGAMVLAYLMQKERMKEAEERGEERRDRIWRDAVREKREDETLEEAVARLESERRSRR